MTAELRSRAIKLLARRERSRAELHRLLDPDGNERDAVRRLLDELQAQGWLSEVRLAEQVVNARRSRLGAARVRLELRRRGLDADTVSVATQGLDAGDFATATALWQRRFGRAPEDRAQRERQLRFLLTRGFSRSVALQVMRAAGSAESNDHDEEQADE